MARMLLMVVLTLLLGASLNASPASAAPRCADTAPFTRVCASPGHTAITTTPNPNMTPNAGWGFGWGTPVIGLGGGGAWIGF